VMFGLASEVCSIGTLTTSHRRDIAVKLMGDFEGKPNFTARDFEKEPVWKQRSNLAAAAHAPVKLAVMGYALDTRLRPRELSAVEAAFAGKAQPAHVLHEPPLHVAHVMARMEHNRWVSERLLNGWTFAPTHDTPMRTRPSLVDWDSLPSAERQKDRQQVERLRRICNDHEEAGASSDRPRIHVRPLREHEAGGSADARCEQSVHQLHLRDVLQSRYIVGWTGHRERIVEHAVLASCVQQLQMIRSQAGADGVLAIGATAGGADRVFIAACREVGVPFALLHASRDGPVPQELVEGAMWVHATPEHYEGDEHYVAIARAIASRAKLLLAVWDESRMSGVGGTGEVVRRAAARVGDQGQPQCAVRIIDPTTGSVRELGAPRGE
jgi:hypothetical protein